MEVRRLVAGDEDIAERACRVFGAIGELDAAAFLGRAETALFIAEDQSGVGGWVYGHELVHPDGERTMLLYALDVGEFEAAAAAGHWSAPSSATPARSDAPRSGS